MIKADVLVPLWPEKSGAMDMEWKSERPVLIAIESLGTRVLGKMLEMSPTRAQVLPDVPLLLFNKTRANVSFRVAEIAYSLSGVAITSECDESFLFEFDEVTRSDTVLQRSLGVTAAHLYEFDDGPPLALSLDKRKRTSAEQRYVLDQPPPDGVERRVDRRQELETHASLLVLQRRQILKCTLIEVSASGCRLYSEVPFHLGKDARVEVEFVGLGQPFRLAAEIKPKDEEHLVGLRFTYMSSRCKERLLELLGDLAEMNARF
jgi:hypothetical protein